MSRLFYTKPSTPVVGILPTAKSGSAMGFDDYAEKVSKLIPSEIVAGYLTLFGMVSLISNPSTQKYVYVIIFAVCLVLTPIYLSKVAEKDKPKRNHLIVSTIAFIIWAYTTTGATLQSILTAAPFEQALASIILVIFSLISAVIPMDK
jgi:hypothetical protein